MLWVGTSWKMNHNLPETKKYLNILIKNSKYLSNPKIKFFIIPPFTSLALFNKYKKKLPFIYGAQNMHWEEKGALTGEVSTEMLAKLNVSFVLVGHSERRHVFGETNEDVNRKLHAIISKEMTPILCVGETLEQRESGETANVVESQLKAGLDGVALKNVASMVIAYEPVWAIGTGKNATPEDAQEVCNSIRSWITENWKADGEEVRIQYGGSVKGVNAPDLMKQTDIDGLLVGGASLDPDEFSRIIKYRLVD